MTYKSLMKITKNDLKLSYLLIYFFSNFEGFLLFLFHTYIKKKTIVKYRLVI